MGSGKSVPHQQPKNEIGGHISYEIIRKKEFLIEEIPKGYPKPEPSNSKDSSLIIKDKWFKDGTLSATPSDNASYDLLSDWKSVLEEDSIEFTIEPLLDMDKWMEQAKPDLLDSFEKFTQYIKDAAKDNSTDYEKILMSRAIVKWMSLQRKQQTTKFLAKNKSTDCPRGLINLLKDRQTKYATCFAFLCRKAGLECVIIQGLGKTHHYKPGDQHIHQMTWNAVYVENGWQIVHPYWICHPVGCDEKKYYVRGNGDDCNSKIVLETFQERYFMPKPEEFVYECWAYDEKWQLLGHENVVKNVESFLKMPFFHPPYFASGFRLTNDKKEMDKENRNKEIKCILQGNDGICNVEFDITPVKATKQVLHYELMKMGVLADEMQTNFVYKLRTNDGYVFKIKLFVEGEYKFVVYGGPYQYPALRLCEFKIVCKGVSSNQTNLPNDDPHLGWGPSPYSHAAGLIVPSKLSGLIPVSIEKTCTLLFYLRNKEKTYTVRLTDGGAGHIECKKEDVDRKLIIHTTLKSKSVDEVALYIYENAMSGTGDLVDIPVCKYLLVKNEGINKANVNNAREKLRQVYSSPDEKLEKRISEMSNIVKQCNNLPVMEDDIIVLKMITDFLSIKKELLECKLHLREDKTQKIIKIADQFIYKEALEKEIKEAKNVLRKILSYAYYSARIPTCEEALKEISNMNSPPEIVQNTVKAFLVLLGKIKENSDWKTMLQCMKSKTLLKTMEEANHIRKSEDVVQTTIQILNKYEDHDVRKANSSTHTLYIWTKSIVRAW